MKTQEEIQNCINLLKEWKKVCPEFTHFGDNNYERTDFQIKVLEEDLDEDDIESSDESQDVKEHGLTAYDWMYDSVDDFISQEDIDAFKK